MKHKLLITSVGSRVGQALLECLEPLRQKLHISGTNSTPDAVNLFACDKAWLLPETAREQDFCTQLAGILRAERPDLVIPARDQDLEPLARLRAEAAPEGTLFLVPPADLTAVFNDKYRTWQFAREHALPFARTAFTPEEVDALLLTAGLPLVAKPRWGGHASQGVYLVQTRAQLAVLQAEQRFVFQELLNPASLAFADDFSRGLPWVFAISDAKYIAELLIGRDGEMVSLSCCSMTGSELGGKNWYVLGDAAVETVARAYGRVLAAKGLRGPLNLQGKLLADGRFVAYELNARFTGSVSARAALGYNQPLQAIRHFLEGQDAFEVHRPGPWLCAAKTPQCYTAISAAAVEELHRTGSWQAEPV
ncbi:MAG: hypothetical protein ACAI44_01760 [Candidatus Sericytochromatia bacterium]